MPIKVCVTSFNITTGSGPVDVPISDPIYGDFTGVCAIFWHSGRTETTAAGGSATGLFGMGFATDGAGRGWSTRDLDSAATSNCDRGHRNDCIVEQGDTAQVGWGTVASGGFTSGNMRITIGDTFTTNMTISCIVLGGDVQAEVGTFTATGTAPVNQTINNTGNFQPDVTFLGGVALDVDAPAQTGAIRLCFGAAMGSPTRQCAITVSAATAAGSGDTNRYADDSLCYASAGTGAPGSVVDSAAFVSHNSSPGGLTINWTARAVAARIHYLMIRSTSATSKFGLFTDVQRADAADHVFGGFGFAPRALITWSAHRTDASITTHAEFAVGAATSANQVGQQYSSRDGNTQMFVQTAIAFDNVLLNWDPVSDIQEGLYKVKSWEGNGVTFSGEDDTQPSSTNLFGFVAVGEVVNWIPRRGSFGQDMRLRR